MSEAVRNIAAAHNASAESLLGEIVDEFLERLRQGERPDVEEYARCYPQLAAVVRQMLPAVQAIHLSVASHAPLAGESAVEVKPDGPLGDFRIVAEIGRGGMGIVYEAIQVSLGRRVALKVLPLASALDARQLQRFKNEVQAAAHLHHPHIVPVYAVGCEQGVHFYAMQFIEGRTLADLIEELRGNAECRNPNVETALAGLAVQAAEALEHAHALGIVHRDIKPANLLVDVRGNLWVTDFGLAQIQTDTRLTRTGDLIGTLRYMSPEQALAQPGGLDHRSDIYSLGATFYELLTLEPAFDGRDHQELLRQIAFEEPRTPRRINQAIPADLETIILKAMAKSAAERYATAQELADDLRRFQDDKPIHARRPSCLERARKWGRRHRAAVWSVAAGLLVALTVSAGSVGWVVRDQAALEAKTTTGIQAALEEAKGWRSQGKWREGEASATRAEALMASGRVSTELRQSVLEVLADLRMCAKLDDVRLLRSGVKDGRFDSEAEDRGYASAFRDYGIDVDNLDPREAGQRIRSRAIRVELAAALDGWARRRRAPKQEGKSWQELVAVAREADPDPVRSLFRQAVLREDREALIEQAASMEISAMPPVTQVLLAEHLVSIGRDKEAIAMLRRAQEQHPGDFWINHNLAFYLVMTGHADDALAFYRAAVALRPDSPGARLNLGVALRRLGELKAALAATQRAIKLKPDYAEAHNNLGMDLAKLGRVDEAIAAFRQAVVHGPKLSEAHYNLGVTLETKEEFGEAIAAYEQAIRLRDRHLAAHINRGGLLQRMGLDRVDCRQPASNRVKLPHAHRSLQPWPGLGRSRPLGRCAGRLPPGDCLGPRLCPSPLQSGRCFGRPGPARRGDDRLPQGGRIEL